MKVETEVISNETIKPSSPTPDHLRHYQLSFLDQLTPKTYNPLVLFYDLNNDDFSKIAEISEQIKKSLSEVLNLYYPLAGRVKNDRFVDCNDEGISYSIARVNSPLCLNDALKNPNPSELAKFLPFELHEVNEFPVGVRLNVFADGSGIAVGVCVSHQLADALSSIVFIKTWVAVSRGDPVEKPQFVSAELFPPKDDPRYNPSSGITRTVVSKRFVFRASAIEAIRAKYEERARSENERRPSRIESLSVFILSRFLAANRAEHLEGPEKVYAMVHPVNIRRKLEPELPENAFGNLYRCAFTMFPSRTSLAALDNDDESYGYEMVRQIREGIKKVDMDFLRKVQLGNEEKFEIMGEERNKMVIKGCQMISFALTSLCRFPLYDADFGWGEPLWVSSATLTFNNLVAFMDAKKGNAIEAYIGLKEEHLANLEADEEFLKFVSTN